MKLGEIKVGPNNSFISMPDDEAEKEMVLETFGNHGKVFLHWPSDLFERVFDDE